MISLSIFLIVLALVFVAKGVIIVQQAEVVIVERLGKFDRVLQSGFNFIIPVLEAPRALSEILLTKYIPLNLYRDLTE